MFTVHFQAIAGDVIDNVGMNTETFLLYNQYQKIKLLYITLFIKKYIPPFKYIVKSALGFIRGV